MSREKKKHDKYALEDDLSADRHFRGFFMRMRKKNRRDAKVCIELTGYHRYNGRIR